MELLQLLTSQLGISESQAKGGAGLIFQKAREELQPDDFSKIADAVPGINNLISSAPESGGITGMIGSLASKLGGDHLGSLSSLASGFKKLDISPDTITKFMPIIFSFIQEKGGDTAKGLLEKALK